MKHPKHRKIPKALLKTRMFKNSKLEDKVVLGVHVLEFAVIMLIGIVAAATAVFLPRILPTNTTIDMDDKAVEAVQKEITPIIDAETSSVGEIDDREISHGQGQADNDR